MLRKEFKMTQEEVANKLNVSRQSYSNWETGRRDPGIKTLIDLANFFNVSIDYLCGDTNVKYRYVQDDDLCEYINNAVDALNIYIKENNK